MPGAIGPMGQVLWDMLSAPSAACLRFNPGDGYVRVGKRNAWPTAVHVGDFCMFLVSVACVLCHDMP